MSDAFDAVAELGVVPVIAIEYAGDAIAPADARASIARREDIRARRFAEIARNARAAVQRATEIRDRAK